MSYTFGMRAPTVKASQSAQPSAAAPQQPATGTTSSLFSSARMPTQPGVMSGNMSLSKTLNPLAPAAPQAPKITENITDQYFEKEKTKSGMLSTFLGRDTSLSSNVKRRNELSNLLA